MADIERVITGLRFCSETLWNCDKQCPYGENGKKEAGACWVELNRDALALLTEYKELKTRHATIVKAADDMLAELKERRWIPVGERLPEDGSDILVYCNDGEESRIVDCNYDNGVWFDCVFNTVMVFKNITHWMPLPKPPKMD